MNSHDDLRKLRDLGVRRAAFHGEELIEVEFFGSDAPPATVEGATSAIPVENDAETAGYEKALSQIGARKFEKGGAA